MLVFGAAAVVAALAILAFVLRFTRQQPGQAVETLGNEYIDSPEVAGS